MFINNKYTKWYWSIINKARLVRYPKPKYIERHHIIPRCVGGGDDASNIVELTGKEHYLVHLLLPHMVTGKIKYKLQIALWRMCTLKSGRYQPSARAYELAKQKMAMALSNLNSGRSLPLHQREAMKGKPAHNKGKKMNPQHGKKISEYRSSTPDVQSIINTKIASSLKQYHANRAAEGTNKCPKFAWIIQNTQTGQTDQTNNLRKWCQEQGFSSAAIYKKSSVWSIISKVRLRDNVKLI